MISLTCNVLCYILLYSTAAYASVETVNISALIKCYSLSYEDNFDGPEINTDLWVVANTRDLAVRPRTRVPGAVGQHLLNHEYSGYITEEDTYIEDGNLVLRNQKRTYTGTSPEGSFDYTSG